MMTAACTREQDVVSGAQGFNQFLQAIDSCRKNSQKTLCIEHLISQPDISPVWMEYAKAISKIDEKPMEAIQLINDVLPLTENQELLFERAKLLELRSSIHFNFNDRQQGANDLYEAIDIYVALRKHREAGHALVGIANLQFNSENYDLAKENGERATEHYLASKNLTREDSSYLMNCYNTLGLAHYKLHNLKTAANNYNQSLAIAKALHEEFWIALINGNAAHIDAEEGRSETAIQKLNTDIRISLKFKEIRSAAASYLSIGEIYMKPNNLSLAKVYYDSALYLYTTHHITSVDPRYNKLMAEWHDAENNKSEAYMFLKRYLSARDSMAEHKNSLLLQQLQTKRIFQKQLADINLLAANNKLKEEGLRIREVSIIAFMLILLLLLLLVFNIRRSNAALRNVNNSLEAKVKQRMAAILKLNKELDTYLYRASHDIRGPILSIQGLVHLFNFSNSAEETKDLVNKIDSTAKGMDSMLLKLQMAYELNIRQEFEEVNIYDLLASTIAPLKERYPTTEFIVQCNNETKIYTNLYHLCVALSNVIENACIFRNPAFYVNKVQISVSQATGSLEIRIEDNGIGIPYDFFEKIFEAFQRFSTLSTGNGMGLYLSNKAISSIGGTIKVSSQVNKGSVFTIMLPSKLM